MPTVAEYYNLRLGLSLSARDAAAFTKINLDTPKGSECARVMNAGLTLTTSISNAEDLNLLSGILLRTVRSICDAHP